MNYALIFAGGTGQRMKSYSVPKQLLKVHNKPIIIHTVEKFQHCEDIDGIVIVSYEPVLETVRELVKEYRLDKVKTIIPGGSTGQSSIFNGLLAIKKIVGDEKCLVLLHDGVRPLVTSDLIRRNIKVAIDKGNCVTISKTIETIATIGEGFIDKLLDRERCKTAKAPQTFFLDDILIAHKKALSQDISFIDSASLMKYFGSELFFTECDSDNIKITTQMDFYMFKGILDAIEYLQIDIHEDN